MIRTLDRGIKRMRTPLPPLSCFFGLFFTGSTSYWTPGFPNCIYWPEEIFQFVKPDPIFSGDKTFVFERCLVLHRLSGLVGWVCFLNKTKVANTAWSTAIQWNRDPDHISSLHLSTIGVPISLNCCTPSIIDDFRFVEKTHPSYKTTEPL